jgi:predicted RNA-binding protein with PUA-like domain
MSAIRPHKPSSPHAGRVRSGVATFLFKTEPGEFSFDELAKKKRATWDGVRNPAALINLRSVRKGDGILIYHTGDEKAIVGLAAAVSLPFEDPKQPGTNDRGEPKFAVVDIEASKRAKAPLTLAAMKADARFAGFDLLRLPRLSVMPVTPAIDKVIRKLTGL